MTTLREKLLELSVAVASATRADQKLDIDIFRVLNPEYAGPEWREYGGGLRHIYDGSDARCLPPAHMTPSRWTGSTDAASSLVPDGCVVRLIYDKPGRARCYVNRPGSISSPVDAATPALALCSAALRAKAMQLQE